MAPHVRRLNFKFPLHYLRSAIKNTLYISILCLHFNLSGRALCPLKNALYVTTKSIPTGKSILMPFHFTLSKESCLFIIPNLLLGLSQKTVSRLCNSGTGAGILLKFKRRINLTFSVRIVSIFNTDCQQMWVSSFATGKIGIFMRQTRAEIGDFPRLFHLHL